MLDRAVRAVRCNPAGYQTACGSAAQRCDWISELRRATTRAAALRNLLALAGPRRVSAMLIVAVAAHTAHLYRAERLP